MLDKETTLKYYLRREVQSAIVNNSNRKEVGVRYGNKFGKRPDILQFPEEIAELAKRGTTSFHCSEELWDDPLCIDSSLPRKEMNELRIGWDLVLDIDCPIFEYSAICADLTIKFLKSRGVRDIGCKFSGNKGFHIGVPFEAFPSRIGDLKTKDLFPDVARKIAFYVFESIRRELVKQILFLENNNIQAISDKVGINKEEFVIKKENKIIILIEKFIEIDTVLISSRHLYRMPYSLHEKSGLVSIPVNPEEVLDFKKDMAKPENVKNFKEFLNRNVDGESARRLMVNALDFEFKPEEEEEDKTYEMPVVENPISEEFFPPCMKKISLGLEDGKKRAIFCIMNYLGKIGWDYKQIETFLFDWNKKNLEPLREQYIKGQLHHLKPGEKLPPNCLNDSYYEGLGICNPDSLCKKIKNPVNYTLLRWKSYLADNPKNKKKTN